MSIKDVTDYNCSKGGSRMVYLDNAATTMIAPEVLEAMMPYLQEQYGNAGALYSFGRNAADAIQTAREQTAMLFGCAPEHVIFTSGGSEGNNMVVKGIRDKLLQKGKTHLILSATEHDSVIKAAESLTKDGFYITYVKPNSDGIITYREVSSVVQDNTGFVSVMMVNNETGTINEIREIGEMCKHDDILFHSDCVQSAGQLSLNVDGNNLDFATISAHKIHGPKGIGAVYIRDFNLIPLIHGGADQEFSLRGGTENTASIVGFGVACTSVAKSMHDTTVDTSDLRQAFIDTLLRNMPCQSLQEANIYTNGYTSPDIGKILNLRIDGVFGETLVLMMDALGVYISAGSACRSHESAPSHVLIAHGLTEAEAKSSVRISFSKYNTIEEIEYAAAIMAECIKTLRSPQGVL